MKEAGDSADRWVWRKQLSCCCSIWVNGPETAAMFGRSASGCCWPLMWRVPILLWSIGTIAWSLLNFWGPLYKWPLYMTHWGLILIFLQSAFGCIAAYNGCRGNLIDDTKYELPRHVKTYWTLYNMAIPIAFLITFFYWALLRGFFYGPVIPIPNPESVKSAKLIMLDEEFQPTPIIQNTETDEPVIPEMTTISKAPEIYETTPSPETTTQTTSQYITNTDIMTTNPNDITTDYIQQASELTTDYTPNASDMTTDYTPNASDMTTNHIPIASDVATDYIPNPNDSYPVPPTTTIAASSATKKPLMYSPDPTLDLFIHGVNSAIMLVELLTAGHPSRLIHVWQPLLVACTYMLIGVVYYAIDGTDPAGNHWIYPMIDWEKPQQALLVTFLCAVYLCLMHALVVLVASIRDKITRACCSIPDTVVMYDGCSGWSVR